MPWRATGNAIDFEKCVREVGTGNISMPLHVKFGDPTKIDNVVLKLNFSGELPVASDILNLLASDPAFNVEGNTLSIDADGDGAFNTSGDDTSV